MNAIIIPVTHEELPVQIYTDLDGTEYLLEFNYNERFDFYTLYIKDLEGNVLFTNKLSYRTHFLDAVREGINITKTLAPLHTVDSFRTFPEISRIGQDNFDQMRLMLIEEE